VKILSKENAYIITSSGKAGSSVSFEFTWNARGKKKTGAVDLG
jgi:hypothetical protein